MSVPVFSISQVMKNISHKTRFFIISVIVTTLSFVLCASVAEVTGILNHGFFQVLKELPVAIILVVLSFYLMMYGFYLIAYIVIYLQSLNNAKQLKDDVARWKSFNSPFISMMFLLFLSCAFFIAMVVAVIEQKTNLNIDSYSSVIGLTILIIAGVFIVYSAKTIARTSNQATNQRFSNAFKIKIYRFLRGVALLILVILNVFNVIMTVFLIIGKYDKYFITLNLFYMNILSTVAYAVAYLFLNRKIKTISTASQHSQATSRSTQM